MKPLGRLHLLTDARIQQRRSHLQLAEEAFAFDSPEVVLQYREKEWVRERHYEELKLICEKARRHALPVIINDYVELAADMQAGAHVGKDDRAPAKSRLLIGQDALLGLTVHDEAELEAANGLDCIDYVGIGPVFGTTSKAMQLPSLGLDGLKRLCALSRHRVIAIGSIDAANLSSVLDQGAYGAAVLGAWVNADKPANAIESLLKALS